MSQRERLMAIAVAILAVFGGGFVGFSWFTKSMSDKTGQIASLERTLSDMEAAENHLAKLTRVRQDYRRRSLSSDMERARSEYRSWLQTTASDHAGLSDVKIAVAAGPTGRNAQRTVIYRSIRCTVTCLGTFEQVTHLLDEYYQADLLHRIVSLDLLPASNNPQNRRENDQREILRMTMVTDALCLPDADERAPDSPHRSPLRDQEEMIVDHIELLTRDFFNPAGEPPKFRSSGSTRIYQGDPVEISMRAEDDDRFDQFTFELDEETIPEELKGKLVLEADDNGQSVTILGPVLDIGRYEFDLLATDNGLPAETTRHEVSLRVEERRQREQRDTEPEFDVAELTKITAALRDRNGRPVVWIDCKPEGELYELTIGESFEIGSVKGVIDRISGRDVYVVDNEKRLHYRVDDLLTEPREITEVSSVLNRQ